MAAALVGMAASSQGGGAQAEQTADVLADPVLRIETGRHAAAITHLATDAGEHILATSSLDKTVRLWDLASGAPAGVLRVPIGPGPEGSLYSLALSPDGNSLLAAGFTGFAFDHSYCIYLFDVRQQRLKTRLSKLPELVNDLAYAPDGKSFAAAFSGHHGVAVWDAASGKLLAEDQNYGDLASGLAFDRSGRLATAAFDGYVRLYGADHALAAKAKMSAGRKLHSVAFSPDGKFLAVGYEDSLWVDVLSTADLKPAYHVDLGGIDGGNLASVGFVAGTAGYDLIAAGTARDKAGNTILRRWADGGKGRHRDTAVGRDTVSHVLGVASGALFASADPSWGLVGADGRLRLQVGSRIADFRDIDRGAFALSKDGAVIEYGIAQGGRAPFRFDLSAGELSGAGKAKEPALVGPLEHDGGVALTDWRNSAAPKVNSHRVALLPQEMARSATAVAGAGRAVIGTDGRLLLVDGSGRILASTLLPATAWGVVASGDQRVVAAALGDGTLRWYALQGAAPLEELVAYFPSTDGKRWIAWTREGFFAHSDDGGAGLAGYQINHGARAAPEWVEFAQLYQLYYAPELLSRKLAGTAEAAIRAKLARIGSATKVLKDNAPPQVDLVEFCPSAGDAATRGFSRAKPAAAPAAGSGPGCQPIVAGLTRGFSRAEPPGQGKAAAVVDAIPAPSFNAALPGGTHAVTLRFRVTDRQGGIGDIDVLVNGKVVSNTRGFARADAPASPANGAPPAAAPLSERTVPLAPGRNLVYVRARDAGNGVESRSPAIELTVAEAQRAAGAVAQAAKPRMFVLGAGVDRYPPPNALAFAVKDMTDVVAALKANKSPAYSDVEVTTLTDEQVSLGALERALDALADKAGEGDTVIIYLSGHGFVDRDAPTAPYYFITQDANPDRLAQTALSQGLIKEKLARFRSRNVFLFLDTCHSGTVELSAFDKVHEDVGGVYILASASAEQQALDSYKGVNGPFAYAVKTGLAGAAAGRGNVVDDHSLGTYVKAALPALVNEVRPGYRQTAKFKTAAGEVDDFDLTAVSK